MALAPASAGARTLACLAPLLVSPVLALVAAVRSSSLECIAGTHPWRAQHPFSPSSAGLPCCLGRCPSCFCGGLSAGAMGWLCLPQRPWCGCSMPWCVAVPFPVCGCSFSCVWLFPPQRPMLFIVVFPPFLRRSPIRPPLPACIRSDAAIPPQGAMSLVAAMHSSSRVTWPNRSSQWRASESLPAAAWLSPARVVPAAK